MVRRRKIANRRIFLEQFRRHFIYSLVRTLSGKNCGDEELPRVLVMKSAGRFRKQLIELRQYSLDAVRARGRRFRLRHVLRRSDGMGFL